MNDRPDQGRDETPEQGQGRDDDAVWRAIIENYGERAELGPEADQSLVAPTVAAPLAQEATEAPEEPEDDFDEHFVPPPAPPVPRPRGARLLAWLGVLGVPVLMLVKVFLTWTLPTSLGLIFMCWFVGGFAYLVANMRKDPPDDWSDDGAVI